MSRLLTAVLLAGSISQIWAATAPTGEISVWPARLGITEEEVIGFFIPEVDEKVREAEARESEFEAWVASLRETSFGQKHGRFLLAAVGGAPGGVPSQPNVEIGILDLDRKKLLWKTEAQGDLEGSFGVFSLGRSGPLAFRYRIHYETDYGFEQVTENWYQPVFGESGELDCRRIWSAPLKTANSAARGGHRESSRGAISRRPGHSIWTYTVRRFLEPRRLVTILRSESWGLHNGEAVRLSERVKRIDKGRTSTFPFDLEQRSIRWRLVADHQDTGLTSPSGEYSATKESESDSLFGDVAVLRRSGSDVPRTLIAKSSDGYGCQIEALGWTEDGDRIFAVIGLGRELALVSFSVSAGRSYWERTLADSEGKWTDGFVLEPDEPAKKKSVKK